MLYLSNLAISFAVVALLARSWNRAFSEQGVSAEAVNSVLALSLLRASPAAFTVDAIPKSRKADRRI